MCWGWRGADGGEGSSDDGEPAGTAGRPIIAAIEAADIVDAVVVVDRIYGGTNLGTGGKCLRAIKPPDINYIFAEPSTTSHHPCLLSESLFLHVISCVHAAATCNYLLLRVRKVYSALY